ncbi:hypothetical protein LP420_25305 [Massilia sp. B-10]|nr:hypothetical protein LP420_25305 [Massilia sp. B-10]
MLDRLDLAAPDRDRQAAALGNLDGGIGACHLFGEGKHVARQLFELILGMDEDGVGHVGFLRLSG